jgi:hypothetical protein
MQELLQLRVRRCGNGGHEDIELMGVLSKTNDLMEDVTWFKPDKSLGNYRFKKFHHRTLHESHKNIHLKHLPDIRFSKIYSFEVVPMLDLLLWNAAYIEIRKGQRCTIVQNSAMHTRCIQHLRRLAYDVLTRYQKQAEAFD